MGKVERGYGFAEKLKGLKYLTLTVLQLIISVLSYDTFDCLRPFSHGSLFVYPNTYQNEPLSPSVFI